MLLSPPPSPHPASGLDRAVRAFRVPRGTDRRAQVHERLVELPCGSRTRRQDASGKIPDGVLTKPAVLPPRRSSAAPPAPSDPSKRPTEHPRHVGVHRGHSSFVREVGHGTGRVASDARQSGEQFRSARDISVVFVDDRAGQLMKMCRPTVVAESLPCFSDAVRARPGKSLDRGEPSDESRIEIDDARDLCLLQHELGDDHAIRIARSSPRQVPTHRPKPLEQSALEGEGVGRDGGRHEGGRYGGRVAGRQGGSANAGCAAAAAATAPSAAGRRRGGVAA